MTATVKGVVMEIFYKEDKETKQRINCVRLFQKGEKKLVEIKNVPSENLIEGETVELKCKLFPWANERGMADIACSYVGI